MRQYCCLKEESNVGTPFPACQSGGLESPPHKSVALRQKYWVFALSFVIGLLWHFAASTGKMAA